MTAPWHMRRRERKFNPETPPLRQWPYIFDDESHRWLIEWNEVVGFLFGLAIVAGVIFIVVMLFFAGHAVE